MHRITGSLNITFINFYFNLFNIAGSVVGVWSEGWIKIYLIIAFSDTLVGFDVYTIFQKCTYTSDV